MSSRLLRVGVMLAAAALTACGASPEAEAPPQRPDGPADAAVPPTVESTDPEIPARFHGTYDSGPRACTSASEYRLIVSARELRFHESIGTVREAAAEGEDSVRLGLAFEGEGQHWTAVRTLRLAEGGRRLIVAGEGERIERVRCGETAAAGPAARWETAASGEGAALFLAEGEARRLTLFCPAGSRDLLVSVPGFRPVASEERMTFGAGGTVVTLVADSGGDRLRGGVSGRGPLPGELRAILTSAAGIAVNYGAQNSGPHPAPPASAAEDFLAGCSS